MIAVSNRHLFLVIVGFLAVLAVLIVLTDIEAEISRPEIIYSALISVLGTGGTILGGYLLWRQQDRAERELEFHRKEERRRTLLVALRAELAECIQGQFDQFGPGTVDALKAKILANIDTAAPAEHSMPAAVVKRGNDIYDNMASEIAELPPSVIGPTIRYYKFDRYVAEILIAFTEAKFEKLSKDRRKDTVTTFVNIGTQALIAGLTAYDALNPLLEPDPVIGDRIEAIRKSLRSKGVIR